MRYLIGTRGSKLALVQTDYVIDKLKRAYPDDDFKAVIIKTTGDLEQKIKEKYISWEPTFSMMSVVPAYVLPPKT